MAIFQLILNPKVARRRSALLLAMVAPLVLGCQRGEELGPVARLATSTKIRKTLSAGGDTTTAKTAVATTGTGWATFKGRFVYDGNPPKMAPYNVNKDTATCTINGRAPLQETLLVDSATSGVANVAIYVRKASRVHESAESTGGSREFDQKQCVFLTHVFPIVIGETMLIKNSDKVGHNTNISGKNGFNQTIPENEAREFKPQKEEAVPVSVVCSIHPWMSAYLLPRKNGYFAVTAPDGSFEIPNLPAGESLEFQVWHESGSGPGGALVLSTPEAKSLKWSKKGRFKLTLGEDEVKEMDFVVPAAAFGG